MRKHMISLVENNVTAYAAAFDMGVYRSYRLVNRKVF